MAAMLHAPSQLTSQRPHAATRLGAAPHVSCSNQTCTLRQHISSTGLWPCSHQQWCCSSWQRRRRVAVSHGSARQAEQPTSNQIQLTASCYEDIIALLADRALAAARQLPEGRKHIIGIAGAPGSGKSTLAAAVRAQINHQEGRDVAVLLPMDGFHYYKRELDQMPDPKAAYARRGAHWTFDAQRFVGCVRRVREAGAALVPAFEHGVGDPVEDAITIAPHHRIVLVEGNYVLLDLAPWGALKTQLLDDTWFVDVDLDTAMDRIYRRQTGNGLAPEVSKGRISGNDRPNGQLVIEESRHHAAVLVPASLPWAQPLSKNT